MRMEVKKIMVIAVAIGLLFGGFAMAQEAEDEGLPLFVQEMLQQLEQEGWTEEQIAEFADAAGERDWEEAEGAEPAIVAMAMQLANQDREQLEGAENADLALELAVMARTMEQSGFEEREIARASFDGTREVVRSMERISEEADTGDQVQYRDRVREIIRTQLDRARSRASGRADKSKGAGAGAGPGDMDRIPAPDSAGRPGRD